MHGNNDNSNKSASIKNKKILYLCLCYRSCIYYIPLFLIMLCKSNMYTSVSHSMHYNTREVVYQRSDISHQNVQNISYLTICLDCCEKGLLDYIQYDLFNIFNMIIIINICICILVYLVLIWHNLFLFNRYAHVSLLGE